jgi:hypothetical protein
VGSDEFKGIRALLQGVDVSYVRQIDPLYGTLDIRAEWVWSDVDRATFDPDGAGGFGPLTIDNKRNGGYVQIAYRPTKSDNKLLRDLEFITRYDLINVPGNLPDGTSEKRLTIGIDYWVSPSAVIKAAYQFDDKEHGPSQNAFLFQMAVGF